MMDLHVWGKTNVSIIDPESRAASWLLCLHLVPNDVEFKIVPSSNTNLAESNRLPLLLVTSDDMSSKYEGYTEIARYISDTYPSDTKFIPDGKLSPFESLVNLTLTTYLTRSLHYVNLYNLYVNSQNYESYTRKLFSRYLPFPMMYNQPLKFYDNACEQVELVGLGMNRSSMFSFKGAQSVAETELVPDDSENEEDSAAISALHEKALLSKEKNKNILRESKNSLRCLNLLDQYMTHIIGVFKELNTEAPVDFAHLFRSKRISSSELLLYSYFHSLTSVALPDGFIAHHMRERYPAFWSFASTITEALNASLDKSRFRAAKGEEIPSLWNEFHYLLGLQPL